MNEWFVAHMDSERERLKEDRAKKKHWRRWGPYLAERQWGTVREDYSPFGTAWQYFPFDQSSLRAYRWGEDGMGGISDNHQRLCFSFAFWNGHDEILKERLYGLAGGEGNHGEDVKELYYYLDATPLHTYMRYLYKYPQNSYPYRELLRVNKTRSLQDEEYELLDTGIFQDNAYFDLFMTYAKQDPEDLLIVLEAYNRGEQQADLHILPTLWLRNTWSWTQEEKPGIILVKGGHLIAEYPSLGTYYLYPEEPGEFLCTENEPNTQKLFQVPNQTPYVKDAFHHYVLQQDAAAVNPKKRGTKCAIYYKKSLAPGEKVTLRFRLTKKERMRPFTRFGVLVAERKREMEAFFQPLIREEIDEDTKKILHQSFSSLLWTKQFYHYVVETWLAGDSRKSTPPPTRKKGRNYGWEHLFSEDILSVPDKWEYPWFASWDTAFQMVPFALLDLAFAI